MSHAADSCRPRAAVRAAQAALVWVIVFILMHVYWDFGGRVGFGDQHDPLPPAPSTPLDWAYSILVWGMFAVGLATPIAFTRPWGQRIPGRLIVCSMWIGCVVLLARGGAGLVDDALRFTHLSDGGLTGMSTQDVLGSAHPSTYTKMSTIGIDSVFCIGGILFLRAARTGRPAGRRMSHKTADIDHLVDEVRPDGAAGESARACNR